MVRHSKTKSLTGAQHPKKLHLFKHIKNTTNMKTKSQLQKLGWLFMTASGGAVVASHAKHGIVNAITLRTLRRKLSRLYVDKATYEVFEYMSGYFGICRDGGAGCVFGGDSACEDHYNREYVASVYEKWDGCIVDGHIESE